MNNFIDLMLITEANSEEYNSSVGRIFSVGYEYDGCDNHYEPAFVCIEKEIKTSRGYNRKIKQCAYLYEDVGGIYLHQMQEEEIEMYKMIYPEAGWEMIDGNMG